MCYGELRCFKHGTKVTHSLMRTFFQEAMFEVAVREDVYEERQNQLRWQIKLGDDPMTNKARQQVLDTRQQAWKDYKVSTKFLYSLFY